MHAAHESGAASVEIWGTGAPRREFMHVDDLADALIYLLEHYSGETPVNIGTGSDIAIRQLAEIIASIIGFSKISLETGLRETYAWMRDTVLGLALPKGPPLN